MFVHEAAVLATWIDDVNPRRILDLGSGTRADRMIVQPHIAAAFHGYDVVWTDIRNGRDVVICDITRPETLVGLPRCDLVTACSLLEHVEDIDAALRSIRSLVEKWLIVSVPWTYPEHRCPIDNLWRPSPGELAARISGMGLRIVGSGSSGPETFGPVANCRASLVLAELTG